MKKIFLIVAVIALAFTILAGCSGAPADDSDTSETQSKTTQPADTATETKAETSEEPEKEGTAQSTDMIEPEQLISVDEAAQLIGEDMKAGEKTEQTAVGLKMAMYEAADEDSFKFIQISVTQQAFMPEGGQTPEMIYQSIISAFDGGEKAEGIGDSAVFATPGIHIMSNGYYISIGAGNSDDEAVREILRQAGALAVENLSKILN